MKRILNFWIPWLIGIFIILFTVNAWRMEVDWVLTITILLGGLIGGIVAFRAKEKQ